MSERRLDAALVSLGLAASRESAKKHIQNGLVTVNGKPAKKPAQLVADTDDIACAATENFVGRGGYKLEKALAAKHYDLAGKTALDVGASTGGFTERLLLAGAKTVYALDVGHGQLHERLKNDPRVVNLEGTDIRSDAARAAVSPSSVDFCSVDVSFISLKLVLPALPAFLKNGADVVTLIKPQFEAGRAAIGKGGIVKDKKAREKVLLELMPVFAAEHLRVTNLLLSPITGGDGNVEYLALCTYCPDEAVVPVGDDTVKSLVNQEPNPNERSCGVCV